MKYFHDISHLLFRWDQVASAFWQRYPNPHSKHVLTEDVISRDVVDGKLWTKRLIKKTNHITKLAQKFVGHHQYTYVVEESIVDPVQKLITTYTRNIGLTSVVSVEEKCTYKMDGENSDIVLCGKEAWISSQYRGWRERLICSFVHQRFKGNAKKAFNGFNHVLESLYGKPPAALTMKETVKEAMKEKLTEKAKKASDVAKKVKTYVPKT